MNERSLPRRIRRQLITRSLSRLVDWQPLDEPQPGYTIIIGCVTELAGVALANLRALDRCDLSGAAEILLVFDRPLEQVDVMSRLPRTIAGRPVRTLGYDARQDQTARRIGWGWVYSWMSWSIGIGASRTRSVVLHDLDAMPLSQDLFARLSVEFESSKAVFQGVRSYEGNGFVEDDGFVATYEMFLDARVLRAEAQAIEAFSRFGKRGGSWVDYDTFLYLEERFDSSTLSPVDAEDLFHPSQLLCQYTDHLNAPHRLPAGGGNLVLLPYLLHLGGDEESFDRALDALRGGGSSIPLRGKSLDLAGAAPEKVEWQRVQVERLEAFLFGEVRSEIEEWLDATGAAVTASSGTRR